MRQKYILSKESSANNLFIREYAATGKDMRVMQGTSPLEEDYTFLCQESYTGEIIQVSISDGIKVLIACLRTDNFFPIGILAAKIAEKVVELYRFSGDRSMELFFDDVELFSTG